MNKNRRPIWPIICFFVALIAGIEGRSFGQSTNTYVWRGSGADQSEGLVTDDWNTASNWTISGSANGSAASQPPTANDDVRVLLDKDPYGVDIRVGASAFAKSLSLGPAEGPRWISVASSLAIGSGGLDVRGGTVSVSEASGKLTVTGDTVLSSNSMFSPAELVVGGGPSGTEVVSLEPAPVMTLGKVFVGNSQGAGQLIGRGSVVSNHPTIVADRIVIDDSSSSSGSNYSTVDVNSLKITGANVEIGESALQINRGYFLVANGGSVTVDGSIGMSQGSLADSTLVVGSNASLTAHGNITVSSGSFGIYRDGTLTVGGDLTVAGNNANGFTMEGGSTVNVTGAAQLGDLDSPGSHGIFGSLTADSVAIQGDTDVFGGGSIHTSRLTISKFDSNNSPYVTVGNSQAAGSLGSEAEEIAKIHVEQGALVVQGLGKVFVGELTIGKSNESYSQIPELVVRNGGEVRIGSELKVIGDGQVRVDADSTLAFDSLNVASGFVNLQGNMEGNILQTGGFLSPGQSPGILTLDGDYTLDAFANGGATLIMELEGFNTGEYDQIFSTGSMNLIDAPTLSIVFWNDFSPTVPNTFSLFNFTSGITGSFGLIDLPTLNEGLVWDTSELHSSGTLILANATAVPEPSATLAISLVGVWLAVKARHRRRQTAAESVAA